MFVSDWFPGTKFHRYRLPYMSEISHHPARMRGMHSRMHESEAAVLSDMGVVLECDAAAHTNEASVQSASCVARSNAAPPHSEEARVHEDDVGVHREPVIDATCDSAHAGEPGVPAESRCICA